MVKIENLEKINQEIKSKCSNDIKNIEEKLKKEFQTMLRNGIDEAKTLLYHFLFAFFFFFYFFLKKI